jgi:uncharacterized protein (TIGR03435 family)
VEYGAKEAGQRESLTNVKFLGAVAALLFLRVASAQPDARLTFDVASIKPSAPDAFGWFINPTPSGRINVTNMTLKQLILAVYHIQAFQVIGGAAWIDSVHYNIEAKPDTPAKPGDWPIRLGALLTDRFHLVFHRETKELPVYALVMAKKGGKLGRGMTESKVGSCRALDPSKPYTQPEPGTLAHACGTLQMGPTRLTAVGVQIADLAPMLSRSIGQTVIDKTGLPGKFDITMDFALDESQLAILFPVEAISSTARSDPTGPSQFNALQEQLGLKLESAKGPVEVLVIDHAEKPSEN